MSHSKTVVSDAKLDDSSLREVFGRAEKLYHEFKQSPLDPSDAKKGDLHKRTFLALLQCEKLINKEGVFSTNEVVDDVNSVRNSLCSLFSRAASQTDLKYVLVPYWTGNIIYDTPGVDGRADRVKKSLVRSQLSVGLLRAHAGSDTAVTELLEKVHGTLQQPEDLQGRGERFSRAEPVAQVQSSGATQVFQSA